MTSLIYICPCKPYSSIDQGVISEQVKGHDARARDLRITAFATAMITVFILAVSYALFGLGSLPPTTLMGLGMFPALGGTFLGFLAIGTAVSSFVFLAISGVESDQKRKWKFRGKALLD